MNEQLLQKVLSCSKLPSLPQVAMRVIELTGDENLKLQELASVIEKDQGLASRILKTVNSAFYGLPKQCSTLTHAQSLMGIDAIKTLALGFSLLTGLREGEEQGFNYVQYWRRAVYSAVAAKAVAIMVRNGDAEEAFLGGLLQDIGMIALCKSLGDEYIDLVRSCGDDHRALVKKELAEYELQHPDVGAMLAQRWKLPETLVMPIKYHERPTAAPMVGRAIVRSVALGNIVADILMQSDRAYWLSQFYQRAHQWFALTATQADEIIETVTKSARDVAKTFDVDMGPTPKSSEILELASERLATIALQENRNAVRAAAATEEIRRALEFDALTGLRTRSRFTEIVNEQFERARQMSEPLSVLLLDADQFWLINDELGSDTGDIVLVRLAQRLTEQLADLDVAAFRYGGEEFGVILSGVNRVKATEIGEQLRRAVGSRPLELGPALEGPASNVALTVSVGVATLDGETEDVLVRGERLIHAADKAVRAAKEAGGNCLRAFRPKRRKAA